LEGGNPGKMKIQCPSCKWLETVKNGKKYTKSFVQQLYFCNTCNMNFIANMDFKRIHFRPDMVLSAVYLYNKGVSADDVIDYMEKFNNMKLSKSSLQAWNKKYSEKLAGYISQLPEIKKGYKSLSKESLLRNY
jgi:transposase-like protein